MSTPTFICNNAECAMTGYIWEVERDEKGRPLGHGPKCPGCGEPGHKMNEREKTEAGV